MSRKLTVDVEVIDPRNGDNFGFKVYNDGVPLIFTQSGYPDSNGWNKTYVTGTVSQVIQCNRFLKLNSDLEVQESNINVNNGVVNDLLYINDDNILLVGQFNNFNTTTCNNVIKTDINGITFSTFETGFNDAIFSIKRNTTPTSGSPLGTALFSGDFISYKTTVINRLLKTDINGFVNTGFVNNVMSNSTFKGFNNRVYDIDEQPSGNIIAVGDFTNFNGNSRNRIVKLNSNGTINTSFSIGSGFAASTSLPVSCVRCDGTKIYVGGGFTTYNSVMSPYIIKLNDNGSPDSTFTPDPSLNGPVLSIEINSSSQVFIGGSFTKGLARLNSNGSIDNTFNIGTGFQRTGGAMKVSSIAFDSSGNIYVGGDFNLFNGQECLNFVKLNSSGILISKLDLNYQVNGNDIVKVIKLDSSGNVYIGGSFTNYKLENNIGATGDLYNIPLSDDIIFNFGTAFNGTVYKSTIYNNEIICFGDFTTYKTTNICNSVAKLTLNGDFIDGFTGTTEAISYNAIVLSDGSFIIAGVDNADGIDVSALGYIIKFNNDLTQDVTFNSGEDGFSYKPYNFSFDPEIPFITKKNDDSNIIFGLRNYDGYYNGNSIDFFNSFGGRLICINSNGDYISIEQIGRGWYSLYYNNDESRIIFNSVSSSIDEYLEIYNSSFIIQTTLRGVFRSLELSNGNIVIKGSFNNGSSYFDEYGIYSYSFGIISPDGLTSIKENSGVGLNNNNLPNNNIWTDGELIYVYNNSTGITYNGINVNKLFRLNQDLEIDTSFNYSGNILIKDILFKSNYILLLGDDIEVINYDGDIINSIGDIEQTIQNTYDNLVEFNSGYGVTYSIISNKVRMEYTFEDDEIVVQDLFDVPDHVELTYTNESININERINEIVTRSDHKIQTQETGTFSYTNFKIRIYEGSLFSGVTASPVKYNITKPKIVSTQTNVYIDVSNLIKEDFEWNIGYFYSNNITNAADLPENISKWVYIEETNYLGTASVSLEKHYLYAIDGYLLNDEIQHLPNLLVNGSKRYVHRDQQQRIYFQTNFLTGIQVIPEVGSSYTPSFDVNTSLNNTRYVQSLSIDKPVNSRYIDYIFTYSNSVETIRYYFYGDFGNCGNEYQELIFKNKWGVLESLAVPKKYKINLNSISEDYTRSIVDYNGNYDITRHTNRKFDVDMEESFILNTDVLPEYMTDSIIDLYASDEVWLKNNNGYIPVIVDGSVNDLKKRIDGPISYNIKVNASHRKIKNIL